MLTCITSESLPAAPGDLHFECFCTQAAGVGADQAGDADSTGDGTGGGAEAMDTPAGGGGEGGHGGVGAKAGPGAGPEAATTALAAGSAAEIPRVVRVMVPAAELVARATSSPTGTADLVGFPPLPPLLKHL